MTTEVSQVKEKSEADQRGEYLEKPEILIFMQNFTFVNVDH